jgi:hypothetical protein
MLLVRPSKPLSSKRPRAKGAAFKSTTELEYENYRSSSWDSGTLTKKELKMLQDPLIHKGAVEESFSNPYLEEGLAGGKGAKKQS